MSWKSRWTVTHLHVANSPGGNLSLWKVIAALFEIKSDYPSYDTFRRVLNSTNNQELAEVRKRWHESIGITYVGDSRNNCEKDSKEFEDFSRDWIEKAITIREVDSNEWHPAQREYLASLQ